VTVMGTSMLTVLASGAAPDGQDLGGVAGWAVDLMERLGGPGAGLAIALENLFPPMPSEVILPLAGFTASQGDFSLTSAIVWTTIGSVVGAIVMYYLGAALGRTRMYAIWDRLPLVSLDDLERTEAWFLRHGAKAVFFGRMVPLFRSLISVPAGVTRMSMPLFLVLTVIGSAIWNTLFIIAGYLLGEQWHRVEAYAGRFKLLVIVAVVVFVGWWLVRKLRRDVEDRRKRP
jgi:membrane protein DedA with SNARE-associated domain